MPDLASLLQNLAVALGIGLLIGAPSESVATEKVLLARRPEYAPSPSLHWPGQVNTV